jgi:tetratricopeptide (TPR) repeat protein
MRPSELVQKQQSLDDLIFGSGPANEPRRDIDSCYHVILAAKQQREIGRFLAGRWKEAADAAADALSGMLGDEAPIVTGMFQLSGGFAYLLEPSKFSGAGSKDIAEALEEKIDDDILKFLEIQKIAKPLVETRRGSKSPLLKLALDAERRILDGACATGIDRNEAFAEARRDLEELLREPEEAENPTAWLQLGWVLWKGEKSLAEAIGAFERAAEAAKGLHVLASLAERHLAHLRYLTKDLGSAHAAALNAYRAFPSTPVFLECARYSVLCRQKDQALTMLRKCVEAEPLSLAMIYAEPELEPMREECLELADELAKRQREAAVEALGACKRTVQAASQALGNLKKKVQIPSRGGSKAEMTRDLDRPDFCTLWCVEARANARERDVAAFARQELQREHAERLAVVRAYREKLDEIFNEREAIVGEIWKQKEAAVAQIRRERVKVDDDWASRNGCGLGLVGFTAGVLLYLSTLAWIKFLKGPAALEGLFGTVSGVLVLASIIVPTIMQISYGVQRGVQEGEFRARIREAEAAAEAARAEADRTFRNKQPGLREKLVVAEAELSKIEHALSILAEPKQQQAQKKLAA